MDTVFVLESGMLLEICIRLVAAVLLGGLIGWERAGSNHDAGLRTHILVCLGAATVMVVSEMVVKRYGIETEMLRMGAQIISGIGFLGAGSILIDGNRIRGITTAAGIWTTACVGIAIGIGCYFVAALVVILMLFAMTVLRGLSSKLQLHGNQFALQCNIENKDALQSILKCLTALQVSVKQMKTVTEDDNTLSVHLQIVLPVNRGIAEIMIALSENAGVTAIRIE